MTDLRKAAEMALEAWAWDWSEPRNEALRERMEALRQALAQPKQDPVAWGMPRKDGLVLDVICPQEHAREPGDYTIPLYTAPPKQPGQEPVGYVIRMTGQYHTGDFCGEFQSEILLKQGQVLYTAPPKREFVGLAKEEKFKVLKEFFGNSQQMIDAVEAKLKEKNT